jgi:hypothetical protein
MSEHVEAAAVEAGEDSRQFTEIVEGWVKLKLLRIFIAWPCNHKCVPLVCV